MIAVVVTSAFVSDDTSKTMSFVIGVFVGSRLRWPNASWKRISSPRPTSRTAPGNAPAAIPCSIAATARLGSTVSVLHDRRLERDEPTRIDVELDRDAERQRQVLDVGLRGCVSRGQSE